jgi:hypothetical protein
MIPDIHVHTDSCWKENLACAQAKIETLELELGEARAVVAKYQLAVRDIGAVLDRMEAAFARLLNSNGKR